MTRLASAFRAANVIRKNRPLTDDELRLHVPSSPDMLLRSNRREDEKNDLWTVYQRTQENVIRGGQPGRNAKGGRARTRAINSIDGDLKTNRFLWSLAEKMKELKG